MQLLRHRTVGLLLVLALVATACGGDEAASDTTTTQATTTTAATTTTVATFDLVLAADEFLTGIPEGWMAVGDLTAFKEAVAASNATLLDVRTEGEYAEGHIEGAINIPLRTLADNLDKIPTDAQVFVYCKSGHRAALAVGALRMLGYDNVLGHPPGWNGWTAAEEPVSTDAVEAMTYTVPDIDPTLLTTVDEYLNGIPEGFLSAGNVEKVKEAIAAGAFLLDVRTPEEFAEGRIPGAVNASLRDMIDSLADIPEDTNVVIYCGSGWRAGVALSVLQTLGYENTKSFPGSWKAWKAAGEDIET